LVWNQLYDNSQFLFLFAKQTNANQTGGQWYSDTSPPVKTDKQSYIMKYNKTERKNFLARMGMLGFVLFLDQGTLNERKGSAQYSWPPR
jgi:hypothetical protein